MKQITVSTTIKAIVTVGDDAEEHDLTGKALRAAAKAALRNQLEGAIEASALVRDGALFGFKVVD